MRDGYKQTDLGMIPSDWDAREIRSVCKLVNGRGFKPHEWKLKGLPIIRIQNLNGSQDYNYFEGAYDSKLEIWPGQLLFAWSGSKGTSFGPHVWTGTLGLLNYHTWKLQVRESEIEPEYFFHALRRLTLYIEGRAHGASALVHVQKWEMEGFAFPAPTDRTEQRAIAEALGDVDALLASLDRLIAKKRDIKQATMQQLLTGKTRLPGFSGEWKTTKLRDAVATPITDGPHLTPVFLPTGIPFLSVNNLVDNRLDFSSLRFISMADHIEFSKKCKPRKGDILFGKAASVGMVALIETDTELNIWSPLALIRVAGTMYERFVFYALQATDIGRQIKLLTNASSQGNIGMSDIGMLQIPVPTLPEQDAIAAALSDIDCKIASNFDPTV